MKLQRLQKELRLVKEAAANRPKKAIADARPLTELDDPRKSVYYDPLMNPFGAPPPGKMRLYHRRGGGTTLNKDEAVVPGLEEEAIMEHLKSQPQYISGYGQDGPSVQKVDAAPPQVHPPPPPPPPPPPFPRQQWHPTRHPLVDGSRPQEMPIPPPPPPKKDVTTVPPQLPKPSAAVARNRKRKLATDIWASNEEVEYELQQNNLDLEEGVEKSKRRPTEPETELEWFYLDNFNTIQGPYAAQHLQQWQHAGYFPPQTLVRRKDGPFERIDTINFERTQTEHDVDNEQARIERLRRPHHRSSYREEDDDNVDDDDDDDGGVQARIAALRDVKNDDDVLEHSFPRLSRMADKVEDGVDTIMKSTRQKENGITEVDEQRGIQAENETLSREASQGDNHPSSEDRNQASAYDRSLALSVEHSLVACSEHDTQYAVPCPVSAREEPAAYPLAEFHEHASFTVGDFQEPPAYPVADFHEPPAYPVAEFQEPPAYPVAEFQEPPAYPVAEFQEPPAYPVGDDMESAYPTEDDVYLVGDVSQDEICHPVTAAYPAYDAHAAYPVDMATQDDHPDMVLFVSEGGSRTQKKVVEVDKDIVGLIPSHLQQKRRAAKKADKNALPKRTLSAASSIGLTPSNPRSIGDDYEKFMKQLSGL